MDTITAKWHSEKQVQVFYDGLHVANVCLVDNVHIAGGQGWRTFPLTTAGRPGRNVYPYPADAIKAYYGKMVQIEQGA